MTSLYKAVFAGPDASTAEAALGPERVREIMEEIYARGDWLMLVFLSGHFVLAVLLAAFYSTWFVTLTVGVAGWSMFAISVVLVPRSKTTRVIAGIALLLSK